MRHKKRIGRIAKDETVITEMVTEDIQDLFDKMRDACDDRSRAHEAYHEDKTEENAKVLHHAFFAVEKAKHDLWTACHERYGHWGCNIGIRDGYALVKMPDNDMPDFLKGMLKKLKEEMGGED